MLRFFRIVPNYVRNFNGSVKLASEMALLFSTPVAGWGFQKVEALDLGKQFSIGPLVATLASGRENQYGKPKEQASSSILVAFHELFLSFFPISSQPERPFQVLLEEDHGLLPCELRPRVKFPFCETMPIVFSAVNFPPSGSYFLPVCSNNQRFQKSYGGIVAQLRPREKIRFAQPCLSYSPYPANCSPIKPLHRFIFSILPRMVIGL